jgi:hypothetical protein
MLGMDWEKTKSTTPLRFPGIFFPKALMPKFRL